MPISTPVEQAESIHAENEEARFASFYNNLLAAHDLLENVKDIALRRQFRDVINRIEDDFSQDADFNVPRTQLYQTLRLGIVGGVESRKASLLQRFMTGEHCTEEGLATRHKKAIILNDVSYLLLMRDESGPPEARFSEWCDGVLLVFSLEDELSFNVISSYYAKMLQARLDRSLPCLLTAIQSDEGEGDLNFVSDTRIKRFLGDHPQCQFFSVSTKTGENVQTVFEAAVLKMTSLEQHPIPLNGFLSASYTSIDGLPFLHANNQNKKVKRKNMFSNKKEEPILDDVGVGRNIPVKQGYLYKKNSSLKGKEWKKKYVVITAEQVFSYYASMKDYIEDNGAKSVNLIHSSVKTPIKRKLNSSQPRLALNKCSSIPNLHALDPVLPGSASSPSNSTPTTPVDCYVVNNPSAGCHADNDTPDVHDGSPTIMMTSTMTSSSSQHVERSRSDVKDYKSHHDTVFPTKRKHRKATNNRHNSCEIDYQNNTDNSETSSNISNGISPRKNSHRKQKSTSSNKDSLDGKLSDDDEDCSFSLINFDGKTWDFDCGSCEERESWVTHIESGILNAFKDQTSNGEKSNRCSKESNDLKQQLKSVPGNDKCIDCGNPDPVWASLNLGILICIDCAGVHRNLGAHLSRVRSLQLDEIPSEALSVLLLLGNDFVNTIWQANIKTQTISQSSNREEREDWITRKYDKREMIQANPHAANLTSETLIEYVSKGMIHECYSLLVHCSADQVNALCAVEGYSFKVSTLHVSCANADIPLTQLLLWYRADPRVLDEQGYNPIYYAHKSNSKPCADLLFQYGCPEDTPC